MIPLILQKIGVDRMSEFVDTLKELYEEKKDMKNPPRYLETVKDILYTNNLLDKPKDHQETS